MSSVLLFSPAFVLAAIIIAYPLAMSVYISLHDISPQGWTFTGIKHYVQMLTNQYFYQALATSVIYTLLSTLTSLFLGIFIALLIQELGRGKRVVEALFTIPLAVSPILAGIVWSPPAV
ncbi:MAG: hypothetical protein QXQ70_04085, partial [Candidatus Caldarchaeum sp.]